MFKYMIGFYSIFMSRYWLTKIQGKGSKMEIIVYLLIAWHGKARQGRAWPARSTVYSGVD